MPDLDLSEIEAFESRKQHAQACPTKAARERLKPKDRVLFDSACARPQRDQEGGISNKALEKWLRSKAVEVSWQAIRNHRQNSCSCRHDRS